MIYWRRLWPHHWIVAVQVRQWRSWYRWINLLTAHARFPVELAILDEPYWLVKE